FSYNCSTVRIVAGRSEGRVSGCPGLRCAVQERRPRPTSFSHHEKRIRRDQFRSRITRREFIPANFVLAYREENSSRPISFSRHEKRIRHGQFPSRVTRREFIAADFFLTSREQNLVAGNFSLTPPDQNPFRHLPCGLGRHVAMWFTPAM